MEVSCLALPVALEVVVLHQAGGEVQDNGELPLGQLHEQASGLTAVEAGCAGHRRGQAEATASSSNGIGVADLGLEGDEVGHRESSPWVGISGLGTWRRLSRRVRRVSEPA